MGRSPAKGQSQVKMLSRQLPVFANEHLKASTAVLFLLLLPYIEPQIFKVPAFSAGDSAYAVIKSVSAVIVVLIYCLLRTKPSKFLLVCGAMQIWTGLATFINHGSLVSWIGPACGMLVTIMIAELVICFGEKHLFLFLGYLKCLLLLFFVLNVVTYVAVGRLDSANTSFLGIDNRWIYFYLPLVSVSFLLDCMKFGRPGISSWVIWSFCFVHLAVVFSAGAMAALALFPFFYLCYWVLSHYRVWSFTGRILFVVVIALNVFLISGILLSMLAPIITGVFHKDITLEGRTLLWKIALDTLASNPLFGHGMFPTPATQEFFFNASGGVPGCFMNHPHNFALYIAFNGGWPALLLTAVGAWLTMRQLDSCESTAVKMAFLTFISTLAIAALVDSFDFSLVWLLVYLAYRAATISSGQGRRVGARSLFPHVDCSS